MAGMVTALNVLVLENLPGARLRFGSVSQSLWHGANFLMGAVLTLHATRESDGVLWARHDAWTTGAYGVRALCGVLMSLVAVLWLMESFGLSPRLLAARWRELWPVWMLASFGACDALTGVCLATMPNETLAWMFIPESGTVPPGLGGLVGVFVGSIGFSYLAQAVLFHRLRSGRASSVEFERGVFLALYVFSAAARFAVAAYGFCSVADGRLGLFWLTVPVADFTIACAQVALRHRILPARHD